VEKEIDALLKTIYHTLTWRDFVMNQGIKYGDDGNNAPVSETEAHVLSQELAVQLIHGLANEQDLASLIRDLHALSIPPFRAQLHKTEEETIAFCLLTTGHAMIYVAEFDPQANEVYGYMVNMPDTDPDWGCWDLKWMVEHVGVWIDRDFISQPLGSTIQFWEENS
jgi:hypothetical protein